MLGWSPGATPPRPMPSKPPGGTGRATRARPPGSCGRGQSRVRQNAPGRSGLADYRRVERGDVDASLIEARIGGARMPQRAYEQRGEYDEQDTARDLADDKSTPETRAP